MKDSKTVYVREAILSYGKRLSVPGLDADAPVVSSIGASQMVEKMIPGGRTAMHEVFVVVALNAKNKPLAYTTFRGAVTQLVLPPADVFRVPVAVGASAMLIAHNHPSGDPTPSADDISLTEQVCRVAALLDIKMLDHIVLGEDERYFSFLDAGLITPGRKKA